MSTFTESEAFRRGFNQRLAELHGQEKQAGWAGSLAGGAWNTVKNKVPGLLGKAAVPLTEDAAAMAGTAARPLTAAPSLLSRAGSAMKNNVGKSVGAGAVAGSIGTGYLAGKHYDAEATNAMQGMRTGMQSYIDSQGGNNFFGKLMMMLSALFGGKQWANSQYNGLLQHLSQSQAMPDRTRGLIAKHLQQQPATAVTPAQPQA